MDVSCGQTRVLNGVTLDTVARHRDRLDGGLNVPSHSQVTQRSRSSFSVTAIFRRVFGQRSVTGECQRWHFFARNQSPIQGKGKKASFSLRLELGQKLWHLTLILRRIGSSEVAQTPPWSTNIRRGVDLSRGTSDCYGSFSFN